MELGEREKVLSAGGVWAGGEERAQGDRDGGDEGRVSTVAVEYGTVVIGFRDYVAGKVFAITNVRPSLGLRK